MDKFLYFYVSFHYYPTNYLLIDFASQFILHNFSCYTKINFVKPNATIF